MSKTNIQDSPQISGTMRFLFLRSTFAFLLIGLFITTGLFAWKNMVRENNPDLAIPQAVITTEWPGASPDQIEKRISQELEKKIRGLDGLKRVESGSFDSFSMVTVEFRAEKDPAQAMIQLRAKISEAEAEFPQQAKKPKLEQVSVNDTPVVSYMIFGDLRVEVLQQAAQSLKKRLEQVPGVRTVTVVGERKQTVYVRLFPDRLRSLGISPQTVHDRITAANMDVSWGRFESEKYNSQMKFEARFSDIEQLKRLDIIRIGHNRIVRLGDIAQVEERPAKAEVYSAFSKSGSDYKQGVGLEVKKIAGGDTISIINAVRESVEAAKLFPSWPYGMGAEITSNQAELIEESFNEIFNNIWQAMVAVFVVMLLLLTWREATIAGLAIPLTLLSSLGVAMLLGYTLNSLLIIGMVLALGMLVDVFILVMEGMHDGLYSKKLNFAEAALRTVKLYARPALAGQATTILALIPLLAIGGTDGKFIRMLPVTIIICLVVSFIIAFVVCIPVSRLVLKQSDSPKETFADTLFASLGKKLHGWLLAVPLATKKSAAAWMGVPFLVLTIVLWLTSMLPVEMYPKSDGRNLGITIELGPNATMEESTKVAERSAEFLQSLPYLDYVTRYIGKKSPLSTGTLKESLLPTEAPNYIGLSAVFIPKQERDQLAFEYLDEIRDGLEDSLKNFAGVRILLTPDVGGSTTDDPVQIVLSGPDIDTLVQLSQKLQRMLSALPGVSDVRDNVGPRRMQFTFKPQFEALSFYGITEESLATQIRYSTAFDEIGKLKQPGVKDDLPIKLGSYWASRGSKIGGPKNTDELANLQIVTDNGTVVPLGSLVTFDFSQQPAVYVHTDGERAVTVKARVKGRTALSVFDEIEPKLQKMKTEWAGYEYRFSGEKESSNEAYGNIGTAFILAIFLVYSVLTLIFGNFTQPVIVLMSVPLAMLGTFGMFFLTGTSLSFPAIIGLVTLVGIVVNNAIVMVETINMHRDSGVPAREAAALSASERLRPILGTTITTVVGLVPLALSSPMWYPLAMAIVYGLLFSTVVSLVLVPSFFYVLSPKSE
ncbi:MAG: efflux RND transporter permease subunit [Desulfobulbaceae bacterium]|nr:efflux RND transporter permease subunit [Desulfobulbaceae bacterium]